MLYQHPGGLSLTKQLIGHCDFSPGAMVLDIGCGTGTTVEYLQEFCGVHAIGVDISETRLSQGKNRKPGLSIIQATGESLPFDDAVMDGVIAECSLSVMEQVELVLTEIERILVKRGVLAITDVYARNEGAGSVTGYRNSKEWRNLLSKHGFFIRHWEDQSTLLPAFVASLIMEYDTEILFSESVKQAKPGYFLLVAEKSQKEG